MIRVRLNAFSPNEINLPYVKGESLDQTFDRLLKKSKTSRNQDVEECFEILLNGDMIKREHWKFITPKEGASVLIAITPKGQKAGRTLGTVALLALTAYTGGALGAAGYGAFTVGLVNTAIYLGGSALINSAFPLPDAGIGGGSVGADNQSDSQMYSITRQANATKKYSVVPKVYGTHRMFPLVAANPYTRIEEDPVTKKLTQYFYCIYDFGLGPNVIGDIKIGETFFADFNEADYRLVDFNKPDVDEGEWDEALSKELTWYKGDNNVEQVGAQLNANANDPNATVSQYQAVRNADPESNGDEQEILLEFVFPEGLIGYDTQANKGRRVVEVGIEFAEVGTENWHDFSDTNVVKRFKGSNADIVSSGAKITPANIVGTTQISQYAQYYTGFQNGPLFEVTDIVRWDIISVQKATSEIYQLDNGNYRNYNFQYYNARKIGFGHKKGSTRVCSPQNINVGEYLTQNGEIFGKIIGKTYHAPQAVYVYDLDRPTPRSVVVFYEYGNVVNQSISHVILTYYMGYKNQQPPKSKVFNRAVSSGGKLVVENAPDANGDITTRTIYATASFVPIDQDKQYKVRVTRQKTYGELTYQTRDKMTWNTLSTSFDRSPIVTDKRHTFLEIRVRASDQLNGSIQNLNAIVSSVIDVYDDTTQTWSKQVSSNPAWVYADILTGQINKNAINKDRLDMVSLVEWSEYCDEIPTPPPGREYRQPRFEANFVMDYKTTLKSLIDQLTTSCQSSLNIVNGKYGVLLDVERNIPIQLFTPRNSSGFSAQRTVIKQPHAFKVKYIDDGANWDTRELPVYADGYDKVTATNFEELNTFATTNEEQAYRIARYHLAQAKLRLETYKLQVDFENLVATRGDFVKIQHDAMKSGGRPARVKAVVGNRITIDDAFIDLGVVSYGYTVRRYDGIYTSTMTIINSTEADVDGEIPEVGDLIVWGEVGKIAIDCLIKSIEPNDDMSATITLIEKQDAIYDAESIGTLPDYDPQISVSVDPELQPPNLIDVLFVEENSYECGANAYQYFISIAWEAPLGSIFDIFEIYLDIGGQGYDLIGSTKEINYKYIVNENDLDTTHSFKVLAVAANGAKKSLGDAIVVDAVPLLKTAAPPSVESLYVNITNETLQLDWPAIDSCDIDYYLIRYSPNANATWEQSVPQIDVDSNTSSASFQARTGKYFIKAYDWNGNESDTPAIAITSIPDLVNLNVLEEINDFPVLTGVYDKAVQVGDNLILQEKTGGAPGVIEYWDEGYYKYENFLDLGEIFTVRLQSLIEADSYTTTDLMVNWVPLASITAMRTTSTGDWDVETQYRSRDSFFQMSNWTSMAAIDPISEGDQTQWTEWRSFTITDATAKIFQFRLKLISNNPSVSPKITNGIIRCDMPDRQESFENILSFTGAPKTIQYTTAFYGPGTSPMIQISQDDAQQGDYYVISNKQLESFDIEFFDKNNIQVQRQFDVLAKGYGRKSNEVI